MDGKYVQEVVVDLSCTLPEGSELIAWGQLLELTSIAPVCIYELMDMGWVKPVCTKADGYLFKLCDVYRIQKLMRLARDLEIPVAAASIVVDLLTRIETLEQEVAELKRLL